MQIVLEEVKPGAWKVDVVPTGAGDPMPHRAQLALILAGISRDLLEAHVKEELPRLLGRDGPKIQVARDLPPGGP